MRQQLEMEKIKFSDLEMVIQNQRQQAHDSQFRSEDYSRQNHELMQELERQKLRVSGLQSHIETLQKYGGSAGGRGSESEELRKAHQTIEQLRKEVADS